MPPSTANRSTITATVRDAAFNLVKGATVNFTLTDVTNGSINPASAVTDQLGQASTVYTASASASQLNNVKVAAAVVGFPAPPLTCNPVDCTVTLTVAQQSLFVVLGTGNLIAEPTTTTFAQPWNVRVTDVNAVSYTHLDVYKRQPLPPFTINRVLGLAGSVVAVVHLIVPLAGSYIPKYLLVLMKSEFLLFHNNLFR